MMRPPPWAAMTSTTVDGVTGRWKACHERRHRAEADEAAERLPARDADDEVAAAGAGSPRPGAGARRGRRCGAAAAGTRRRPIAGEDGRTDRRQDRMLEDERDVDVGQLAAGGRDRQEAAAQRPDDQREAERRLEQRLGQERRRERRVARPRDAPVQQPQLDDVAAARRDDAVEARRRRGRRPSCGAGAAGRRRGRRRAGSCASRASAPPGPGVQHDAEQRQSHGSTLAARWSRSSSAWFAVRRTSLSMRDSLLHHSIGSGASVDVTVRGRAAGVSDPRSRVGGGSSGQRPWRSK